MFVLIGLLATSVATFYIYLTRNFNYWKNRGVVGPTPYPYVGTFPKTLYYRTTNHLQETSEIFWHYFGKNRFVGVFECAEPKLLILDPELIHDIHVTHFKHFSENSLREAVNI